MKFSSILHQFRDNDVKRFCHFQMNSSRLNGGFHQSNVGTCLVIFWRTIWFTLQHLQFDTIQFLNHVRENLNKFKLSLFIKGWRLALETLENLFDSENLVLRLLLKSPYYFKAIKNFRILFEHLILKTNEMTQNAFLLPRKISVNQSTYGSSSSQEEEESSISSSSSVR